MLSEFLEDDQPKAHDAFQRWRTDNPAGFFINSRPSGGWMLHRVVCRHHGNTDWRAGEWGSLTRTHKVASTDRRVLIAWAQQQGVGELKECSDCKP